MNGAHLKIHECGYCEKVFSEKQNLKRLVNRIHLRIAGKYSCMECEATFGDKQHQDHHMNCIHLKIKPM